MRSLALGRSVDQLLAGYSSSEIKLWDRRQHVVVREFKGHAHWVRNVFVEGDYYIVSGAQDGVRIWDMRMHGSNVDKSDENRSGFWAMVSEDMKGVLLEETPRNVVDMHYSEGQLVVASTVQPSADWVSRQMTEPSSLVSCISFADRVS